ncbi:MAG: hypothetical protein ACW98J_02855 [Candidatus Thorarchaeota archaeon]
MADAIEWTNASPDHVVWRYPDNRVKWGSMLIVMENQAAIFYRDGKALDTPQTDYKQHAWSSWMVTEEGQR